jgi:predicted esterase
MRYFNFLFISLFVLLSSIDAKDMISKEQCLSRGDNFIFVASECIEFHKAVADRKRFINIIVHGTWKEGINILGRYASFADDLAIQTDITTIAIALPGYSSSSTNYFPALSHEGVKNLASTKEYIDFLAKIIEHLKKKYNAKVLNYIGHSAGAAMGATLIGYKPKLITNLVSVGGYYDIHKRSKDNDLILAVDFLDQIDKNSKILLIYGEKDKISKPSATKEFYNFAKSKGVHVKLVEVKNGVHLDLDMSDTSVENIVEFLE